MAEPASAPVANPGIHDIAAYVPGKSHAPKGVKLFKLSSNETPLGPSKNAIEAFKAAAAKLEDYPDPSAGRLREAIAAKHGLNAGNIVCGSGSDELLSLLAYGYLRTGDEAIYSEHGFLMYRIAILAAGAIPVIAPETERTANVDAFLDKVTSRTKMVFLANPNNPTGTFLPIEEVRRLHAGLPKSVLLVLDAAYAEYVRRNDYEAGIELVSGSSNVVMTRTFSKIYGLAALRVGWLYGPEAVVDVLSRIRGPFNVNAGAIAAAAEAVGDDAHVEAAVRHNDEWLAWTGDALKELGLSVTPSAGNFLLVDFPDIEGKRAADADAFLTARGYVLRAVGAYGFPHALRMTIGTEAANRGVVETLREFLTRERARKIK